MSQNIQVALVTNIPAPYRIKVFERLVDLDVVVLFCAQNESNRSWCIPEIKFKHIFLGGSATEKLDGFNFVHNNPKVWNHLNELRPEVVVTTAFNPTHLYAYLWAKTHRVKHICMTDGTPWSESSLSWLHKLIRKIVFAGTHSFVAASMDGIRLYLGYGVPREKIFQSHLCANNDIFSWWRSFHDRGYDVMFSGQFHERKLPHLFVEVCGRLVRQRGRCRALLIGDGPMRDDVLNRLSKIGVDFTYAGFVQQNDLPKYYGDARVLLFTTRMDPWGVVANEAMAAGTPVVTTPYAGVAGELVIDGMTGAVCEPDPVEWTGKVSRLLDDPNHWQKCSSNARRLVETYNYNAAAEGIDAACRFALAGG